MKNDFAAVALAAAVCFSLSSCTKEPPAEPPVKPASPAAPSTSPASADPATHTYAARGIIESLPEAGKPTLELMIRHEAINDFIDGAGAVVGMNAMTMPFPRLAPGVSLEGLAVGDKIGFTFTNTWSGPAGSRRPEWVIDSITRLPADTELTFGKKQPVAPEPRPEGSPEPEPESK
jgi:Cu/Ag efflux protein CusF